jgi:hypothetical protein
MSPAIGCVVKGCLGRNASAHDGREILRSGAAAFLLIPAMDLRSESDGAALVENTGAFGAIEAVRRESEQIDLLPRHIKRMPAGGGGGIDEQGNATRGSELADGGDVLNRAEIMVGQVGADENGGWLKRGSNGFRRNEALWVGANASDDKSALFEGDQGFEDGGMFDRRGNDMAAVGSGAESGAFDGEIGGFGASGGENNLAGVFGANKGGALGARVFERIARAQAELVKGGWRGEVLLEEREHGFERLGQERGGVQMIEEDGMHLGRK